MTDVPSAVEPWTARVEMVDGVRLHVLVWEPAGAATGPDVLCVHGLASNALLWSGLARLLAADGHRVVAVDQRAHGRSDPSDALDWATLTADLVAVSSALGLQRPLALGQSWGGNVVVELAARRPDAVGGIVCVDGGTIELSRDFPDLERCWAALTPPDLDGRSWHEVADAIATHHEGWSDEAIRAQQANIALRPDGTATAVLTRPRHRAIVELLWAHRPSALWREIAVPVLLLAALDGGARDDAKLAGADEAVRSGRRVRAHALREAHHDVHAQAPERVTVLILEALGDGFFEASGGIADGVPA